MDQTTSNLPETTDENARALSVENRTNSEWLAVQSAAQALINNWSRAMLLKVRAGEMTKSTRTIYLAGMRKLLEWMQTAQVTQMTPDTLRSWKAEMREADYKPGAVNTWLSGIKAFFAWAKAEGWLVTNPAEGIDAAKRTGANQRHARQELNDVEIVRVLDCADELTMRDRALIKLMAYTGMRTVEAHRADLADLRTEAGKLVLAVQGKGRDEKDEIVVVDGQEAVDALYDWLAERGDRPGPLFWSRSDRNRHGRLSLAAIRTIVKHVYRLAGITEATKTTHSLRHTAITNAIRNGAPPTSAQAMARHRSLNTTMIYYHEQNRVANAAEGYIDYRRRKKKNGNGGTAGGNGGNGGAAGGTNGA